MLILALRTPAVAGGLAQLERGDGRPFDERLVEEVEERGRAWLAEALHWRRRGLFKSVREDDALAMARGAGYIAPAAVLSGNADGGTHHRRPTKDRGERSPRDFGRVSTAPTPAPPRSGPRLSARGPFARVDRGVVESVA